MIELEKDGVDGDKIVALASRPSVRKRSGYCAKAATRNLAEGSWGGGDWQAGWGNAAAEEQDSGVAWHGAEEYNEAGGDNPCDEGGEEVGYDEGWQGDEAGCDENWQEE